MVWTIGQCADMAVPSANIGRSGVVSAAMMRFRGWCRRKIIFLLIPIRRDIPRIAGTARHPPASDKKVDDGEEEGRRPRRRLRRQRRRFLSSLMPTLAGSLRERGGGNSWLERKTRPTFTGGVGHDRRKSSQIVDRRKNAISLSRSALGAAPSA